MSWWDFGLGVAAGQAIQNESKGEDASGCLLGVLYLPMMVELGVEAAGLTYLVTIPLENAGLPIPVLILLWSATFATGGWIYIRITSIFERNHRMRVYGALLSGALWLGLLWYLFPPLYQELGGLLISLFVFSLVAVLKGYSLGMFTGNKSTSETSSQTNTPAKPENTNAKKLGKLALAVALLGPFGLLLKERDREK